MSTSPLVSVILPTYNRSKYLANSIGSILYQKTEFSYEIIIVDDASSDDTEGVIRSIDDAKIRYIRLAKNTGGGKARNTGIAEARGKYVAFIDSDTIWHEQKMQRQVEFLERDPTYLGCYSRFIKISKSGQIILPKEIPRPEDASENILIDNFIDTPTSVVRKNILDIVGGFDENLPRFQDWELFIRLTKLGKFYGFYEPLIDSLELADSISRNDAARLKALNLIFEKHKNEICSRELSRDRFLLKIIAAELLAKKRGCAIRSFFKHKKDMSSKTKVLAVLIIAAPAKTLRFIKELIRR